MHYLEAIVVVERSDAMITRLWHDIRTMVSPPNANPEPSPFQDGAMCDGAIHPFA